MTLAGAQRTIDAIVFDMDGTLIDSSTAVPDAYIGCVRELGGGDFTRDDVIACYPLGPPPNILERLLGRTASDAEVDSYHRWLASTSAAVRVYDGVLETLHALSGRVRLGVFTGASTSSCEILLEAPQVALHFDDMVGSDLVDHPKPDPAGLLLACERLGVAPARTAYVGDGPLDQRAARAAGAMAVSAGWGHLHDPLEPADLIARSPLELVALVDA